MWSSGAVSAHKESHIGGGSDVLFTYGLSDDVLHDNAARVPSTGYDTSTSYVNAKEILLGHTPDTVRIRFSMIPQSTAAAICARIYRKRGAGAATAVGVQHCQPGAAGGTHVFDEDVAGWVDGDLLQLHFKGNGAGHGVAVQDFQVLGEHVDACAQVVCTNQDP